jgi:hypothetical protein
MRCLRHASRPIAYYAPTRSIVRTYASAPECTGPAEGASLDYTPADIALAVDPGNASTTTIADVLHVGSAKVSAPTEIGHSLQDESTPTWSVNVLGEFYSSNTNRPNLISR